MQPIIILQNLQIILKYQLRNSTRQAQIYSVGTSFAKFETNKNKLLQVLKICNECSPAMTVTQ